ncbi:hypothetical protein N7512_001441 [Penicillium capsulatum]|nr:hypothetical protein N7512_001441 [Penicillium capsulatum]
MASTREERLQMRQRGAGTRKIQQVDFGFSFGGPETGAPGSASIPLIPEPAQAPQLPAALATATPPSKAAQPGAQGDSRPQRIPRSARNQVPQRPSTYDIPSDEGPGELLSNKKRRLNPPTETVESPSRRNLRRSPNRDPAPIQNGKTAEAQQRETAENAPPVSTQSIPEPPVDAHTVEAAEGNSGTRALIVADAADATSHESRAHTTPASDQQATSNGTPQSHELPPITQPAEQHDSSERNKNRKSRSLQANKSTRAVPDPSVKRSSPRTRSPPLQRGQKSKADTRKHWASNDAPETGQEQVSASRHDPETEEAPIGTGKQNEQNQRSSENTRKSQRQDRVTANAEISPELSPDRASSGDPAGTGESQQGSPTESASQADKSGTRNRRKRQATQKANAQPDFEVEAEVGQRESSPTEPAQASEAPKASKHPGRKSTKKAQAQAEPEPEVEVEAEPEQPESGRASKPAPSKSRGKAGGRNKRTTETQTTKDRPTATPREPDEAESESPAPAGPSKSERKGKKSNQTETQATGSEETPEQEDAAPRRSTRRPREPRGETVPVTVHRLANTIAFETSLVDAGEDDADDVAARQKKLPNRGGVNPADVLGQICRETLEKTLAALKSGIDKETNQNKRAEWTRKRRAVEAYGTELDGRLLDLSEMLDSNFVLGVQAKKAKRDLMDLRGHLYKVRRERESVALQMDAVRAKHMEEENAKTARMSINNSLHSLELALDRSQNRAPSSSEPISVDLDFLLRTVADDVSSRAPGAQGGLLHQIRSFNAQLESTARSLERP